MIELRELATVLAALVFWKEDICPFGDQFAKPYLKAAGMPRQKPLTATEIDSLMQRLRDLHGI